MDILKFFRRNKKETLVDENGLPHGLISKIEIVKGPTYNIAVTVTGRYVHGVREGEFTAISCDTSTPVYHHRYQNNVLRAERQYFHVPKRSETRSYLKWEDGKFRETTSEPAHKGFDLYYFDPQKLYPKLMQVTDKDNGKLYRENFYDQDGLLNGRSCTYYPNGQDCYAEHFVHGDSVHIDDYHAEKGERHAKTLKAV